VVGRPHRRRTGRRPGRRTSTASGDRSLRTRHHPGHADHLAGGTRPGRRPARRPPDRHRRRDPSGPSGAAVARRGVRSAPRLRTDGDHHLFDMERAVPPARRTAGHRGADPQHAGRGGRLGRPGTAGRRTRGTMDRGRRSGTRLPSAPRTHRPAVWRRRFLPHRGPRAVERGRHAGNLRPRRPADQTARQPDRTGRGRSRPAHSPGRQGRRGRGRRRAIGGVHSKRPRRGPVGARPPVAAARGDPVPVHRHGRAAGQREREGRLPRADPDGATRRAHHHPARALARPARTRGPGRGQQLLHERRPLSARRAPPDAS
jgi:hypothetical protein